MSGRLEAQPAPGRLGKALCIALALCAALSFQACKRKTGPSVHYDRGAALHQQLYVRMLDDAYLDPRMDEVVRELKLVETTSVSYENAAELLKQIEKGKKDAVAARDARAKAQANLDKGLAPPPAAPPGFGVVVDAAPGEEQRDAGAPDPYGVGASVAEINAASGGCLVSAGPFREEGSAEGKSGTAYKLAEGDTCRSKLPGFGGQVVLAVDGRIYRRIAATAARVEDVKPTLPDGGPIPPPQAKQQQAPPPPPPPPKPVPPIPGAIYRTEGPQAYEGQKNAPKLDETAPAKMEESTPPPKGPGESP
jgi:hypothetical protein